ncbi:unnamed protein product (macronuclear) [Paramecium tetraurelia]|uniref:Transmembrane protein n=1 Tax=Paramecium tetraurelia TaxID=5888 RepID=A0DIP9_PARTE|nr:uncharacterized protein GSPATT00017273001 [Paramecium tetraurelia]CAK82916.1 unnamed protein product [Paramecium tetraurelia]|eukprot:XP_001450313.1 hypothetical protein (macronuclear) [Paramecium tetraurelia strain d4-2]
MKLFASFIFFRHRNGQQKKINNSRNTPRRSILEQLHFVFRDMIKLLRLLFERNFISSCLFQQILQQKISEPQQYMIWLIYLTQTNLQMLNIDLLLKKLFKFISHLLLKEFNICLWLFNIFELIIFHIENQEIMRFKIFIFY